MNVASPGGRDIRFNVRHQPNICIAAAGAEGYRATITMIMITCTGPHAYSVP